MSLFKQVSAVLLFIFTILFVLIIAVTFGIIKDSAEKSLYENVQNSVTNLSLSITNSGTEISSIKTVINASFDNGNYEKIIFKDVDDNIVYELKKETNIEENEIPKWFINLVNIEEVSAKSTISNGWNVLGILEIYNDRTLFFEQTYEIFKNLVFSSSSKESYCSLEYFSNSSSSFIPIIVRIGAFLTLSMSLSYQSLANFSTLIS